MKKIAIVFILFIVVSIAYAGGNPEVNKLQDRLSNFVEKKFEAIKASLSELIIKELGTDDPVLLNAFKLITQEELKKHAEYLASDELEGRRAGESGNDKATIYISEIFKEAGLKPVGDKEENVTYFQKFKSGKDRMTRNCLALLEGSDEKLKDEIVVVGGHHDHIGKSAVTKEGDNIYNGADDNASGISCLLSIATAFARSGLKPRRSILFITFSAEEVGLLGSRFYCNHSVGDVKNHTAMINLDMVGRNPTRPVSIQGFDSDETGVLEAAIRRGVIKSSINGNVQGSWFTTFGDSDHSSFLTKKIPSIYFFTGGHTDYHKVTDHADKLDYENMAKIARAALATAYILANSEHKPRFNEEAWSKRVNVIDPRSPWFIPKRRLGITPDYDLSEKEVDELGLAKDQGAIRVADISEDTVAEKCGLKLGDLIIEFNGKKTPKDNPLLELRNLIQKVESKKPVPIIVIREGKQITLTAQWDE